MKELSVALLTGALRDVQAVRVHSLGWVVFDALGADLVRFFLKA